MAGMKISVGYLYPDIMATYGDRGNVETVVRRCEWRDIGVDVTEVRLGDPVDPAAYDLIVIGGGGEAQQRLVAADLGKVKGPGIREAVAQGAAALAVGGGYELFGRFCQPELGSEVRGIELFDAWTIRQSAVLSEHYGSISEARADRAIGELVVRWGDTLLVGFENHAGGTYLGPTARPLGHVVSGQGNNGDGTEGVIFRNAVGTYLRGPCLPKNPALADFLIGAALRRRHGVDDLAPLPDALEIAAHAASMRRACLTGADRSRLRRAAFVQAQLARAKSARVALNRVSLFVSPPQRPAQRRQAQEAAQRRQAQQPTLRRQAQEAALRRQAQEAAQRRQAQQPAPGRQAPPASQRRAAERLLGGRPPRPQSAGPATRRTAAPAGPAGPSPAARPEEVLLTELSDTPDGAQARSGATR
jgi:lipid II isoglutaminyl synthase (glutamine-hydrolysing)